MIPKNILIFIVNTIHFLLNLYILLSPFLAKIINKKYLVPSIYALLFIFVQFLITNNKCIITMLEYKLKGEKQESGYLYRLYGMNKIMTKQQFSTFIRYFVLFLLVVYYLLFLYVM
jgi:hypothetical protein